MKMTRQINAALLIAALSLTAAGCSARADMLAITGNMGYAIAANAYISFENRDGKWVISEWMLPGFSGYVE